MGQARSTFLIQRKKEILTLLQGQLESATRLELQSELRYIETSMGLPDKDLCTKREPTTTQTSDHFAQKR